MSRLVLQYRGQLRFSPSISRQFNVKLICYPLLFEYPGMLSVYLNDETTCRPKIFSIT